MSTEHEYKLGQNRFEDEFAVLEAAFRSGDRERLRLAVEHAGRQEVQATLSPVERAEVNSLLSESGKRLFMNGRA